MKGRALLISHKYPFPEDDGKKTVLAGFADYLVARYGRENFTYVVIGQPPAELDEARSGRVRVIAPPSRSAQLAALATLPFRSGAPSLQEALTWSKQTRNALRDLVDEIEPELVLLDTIRIGQYFESPLNDCRRVLYMDDLFYLRFQRLLELTRDDDEIALNPVGTFGAQIPAWARVFLQPRPLQRLLYRFEKSRIEAREKNCPAKFDACLLINPNEVELLASATGAENLGAIKPVLFRDDEEPVRRFNGAPDFLLFGSLRHPVYRASVLHFIDTCMDSVIEKLPGVRIRIVGAGADEAIAQRVARYPQQLELLGFVDDLEDLFTSACGLLVPLLAAGGLKLKALTALYYGLPMISTDGGLDGIELRDGIDCIRENDLGCFAAQMHRLCDPGVNRAMATNARRTFIDYYSRDSVFRAYDRYLAPTSIPTADAARQ